MINISQAIKDRTSATFRNIAKIPIDIKNIFMSKICSFLEALDQFDALDLLPFQKAFHLRMDFKTFFLFKFGDKEF